MSRFSRRYEEDFPLSERMPVDVMPASNGEFIPEEPTEAQRRIMRMQNQQAEVLRRRLGMTRRQFVRSAAAMGVGYYAINQVMGTRWGSYKTWANPPGTGACDLEHPDAQLANLPGEFIFDVQSHHVDSGGDWRVTNPGMHVVFMALWEQAGPLGGFPGRYPDGDPKGWGRGGEFDPIENLSRYHYLKELYLDSSTTMTVLSAVPTEDARNPLPIDEAAETLDIVNRLAGDTERSVMHAFVMPNRGSTMGSGNYVNPLFMGEEFDLMQRHLETHPGKIRGWKVYTPWGDVPNASGWFLDDAVGDQFIDRVRQLTAFGGPNVIACHKGFALPSFDQRAASPRDIGPAASRNSDINFIVYHSGFDSERQTAYPGDDKVNSSDRGVNCFVKSLRENSWDASHFVRPGLAHGNVPNVFAEIGATMRTVMDDPNELAHLLGKLITHVGPQRVVYGTDSLWFGSPQSVIVGFRAFEFSEEAKQMYNLPYGLQGDRFDPRLDAMDGNNYTAPHPAYPDWPTDGLPHPERTIKNGIFGRNAAVPYGVNPDAERFKIACAEVQKIRDAYVVNHPAAGAVNLGAENAMHAPRTRRDLFKMIASEPFKP